MASKLFNEFVRAHAAGEVDLDNDDLRLLILMNTTTVDMLLGSLTVVGSGWAAILPLVGIRRPCAR